jgi:hypothetical protein
MVEVIPARTKGKISASGNPAREADTILIMPQAV